MIISHNQAKRKGLKHYFTGDPCKRWHVSIRFVTSKRCKDCQVNNNKQTSKVVIEQAITMYGWCCQNCGNKDWTLLCFHHRKWIDWDRDNFTQTCREILSYNSVQKDLFQLLCANCHIKADLRDWTNIRGKRLNEIQKRLR